MVFKQENRKIPIQDNINVDNTTIEVSSDCGSDERVVIVYKNISTAGQTIWLAWNAPAQASKGIELTPGAVWSESKDANYTPLGYPIQAIGSAVSATLSRFERREPRV